MQVSTRDRPAHQFKRVNEALYVLAAPEAVVDADERRTGWIRKMPLSEVPCAVRKRVRDHRLFRVPAMGERIPRVRRVEHDSGGARQGAPVHSPAYETVH